MKKLLLFLSVLVLILALSSCTKKEIVQNDGGMISVNMDLSSGISVSKKTRAAADFTSNIPTSYTAYFIAAEKTEVYNKGDIIKTVPVSLGDNKITLPDIKYNIYISNYLPSIPANESDIKSMIESIPVSSSILYLVKEDDNVIFHSTKTITETLENNYAAVCILNNSFVTGAQYNTPPVNSFGTATYTLSGDWYYLYIKGNSTNTTVWLKNIPYNTGSYQLAETIEANHIYQYTITDNTNCKFIVKVDPFAGVINKDIQVE
jgi:hypothetical protein